MGLEYLPTFPLKNEIKHVGKYTYRQTMDPMGKVHQLILQENYNTPVEHTPL